MKFSDLHSPQDAARVIKDFQKRFSSKVCLAPTSDCEGPIISAHTLSVEGMLRPISRDGHVYAIGIDMFHPEKGRPTELVLKGLRETSVFNGFCGKHDKALFSPIEDRPFVCSHEQLFLHAYRAIAKESYLKRKQAESLVPPDVMKRIHGWPQEMELQFSQDALLLQAASLRAAEEIERTKGRMDQYHIDAGWNRVMTTVIPFARTPTIACNFVYQPDFDFEGNYLQDFENLEVDLSQLMVTVLPHQGGGFALLSHLDTANSAPRQMIRSLTQQGDLTSSLMSLVAFQTENFAISPSWYDGLSTEEATQFMDAFHSNVDPFETRINQLRNSPIRVESWEPGPPFSL